MNLIPLVLIGSGVYIAVTADKAASMSAPQDGRGRNTPGPGSASGDRSTVTDGRGTNTPNTSMADAPRGIRNHNPGNIEKGANWQGLATDQSQDDRFAVFASPVWGIRALTKVLLTYRDRYGIRTPADIIARWAPEFENNTEAYINAVASAAGIQPTDPVTDDELPAVVAAIIHHENGVNPYPDDLILEGIARAYA